MKRVTDEPQRRRQVLQGAKYRIPVPSCFGGDNADVGGGLGKKRRASFDDEEIISMLIKSDTVVVSLSSVPENNTIAALTSYCKVLGGQVTPEPAEIASLQDQQSFATTECCTVASCESSVVESEVPAVSTDMQSVLGANPDRVSVSSSLPPPGVHVSRAQVLHPAFSVLHSLSIF